MFPQDTEKYGLSLICFDATVCSVADLVQEGFTPSFYLLFALLFY